MIQIRQGSHRARIRRTAALLAASLAATASLLSTAVPAQAETVDTNRFTRTYQPASWAYVDATNPLTSYYNPTGDAPVGAWREDADNGIEHRLARSYLSYDLSQFRGKHIYEATLVGVETRVTDCTRTRQVELWETGPIGPDTTWAEKPKELTRIDGPASAEGCPASQVTWDIADRLRAAVDSNAERFTLELRVPETYEGDFHFGRRFASNAGIKLVYNTPPRTPDRLRSIFSNLIRPCATSSPGPRLQVTEYFSLSAQIQDPDPGTFRLLARFALWPVDDPAARMVRESRVIYYGGGSVDVSFGPTEVTDGRTYAWAVQAFDGSHESAWTDPCYFTVDNTPPNQPLISSEEYPTNEVPGTGSPGIPGTFTMRANGDTDLKYFRYSISFPELGDWSRTVAADANGTASVQLTPVAGGQHRFSAYAIDHAGHWSPITDHYFQVRETRPSVLSPDYDADPPTGGYGITSTFEFRPTLPGVVGYEYQLNYDPPRTVAADASGIARIEITPTRGGEHRLTVRSYDAEGTYSPSRTYRFFVDTAPVVTSAEYPEEQESGAPNLPGIFRFGPRMPDVVEYLYRFDDGAEQTVSAAADHTGSLTLTPLRPGDHVLWVRSRSADGTSSESRRYEFYVGSGAPDITSDVYPRDQWAGYPGKTTRFAFRPTMPGVVSYSYRFTVSDDWQTVAADPDGTATVTWTPPEGGLFSLLVVSRAGNGAESDPAGYTFYVNTGAPSISSIEYPRDQTGGYPGKTGTFTLTPTGGMPVTEFRYRFYWNGEWQSVPVGADGTATVTFTPSTWGGVTLEAYGRTAEGARSGTTSYSFWVSDGAPAVSSDTYPEDGHSGGPGIPGTFTFTPVMPVAEYEYFFSDGTSGMVEAGSDGTATITWTPTFSGWYVVYLWGYTSTGDQTGLRIYSFWVNDSV